MDQHKEHSHLDEIARAAALLYGQEWGKLGYEIKHRWVETVRHTARGSSGVNQMEACAGQAIDEWYKKQEAGPVAEAVEEVLSKPKTKKK